MDDSSSPSTKGDVAALATKKELVQVMMEIREQFKLAREDSDRILDVVINIEKRLTKRVDNHEKRITVLEGAMAT